MLLCAGCTNHVASTTVAADWRIALTSTPAAPRQLDPTVFQICITDRSGEPVAGAHVVLALEMPAMDMGRNQVTAQAGPAGIYTATGRFTMPGDWQVTVQADKDKAFQSQSFPISVR